MVAMLMQCSRNIDAKYCCCIDGNMAASLSEALRVLVLFKRDVHVVVVVFCVRD